MTFPTWFSFFIACWLISLSPGAGAIASMSSGLAHGFRRGYWNAIGLQLALILQGYETLLAGTGMDPSDRLELAADRLGAALARGSLPEFLQGRAVFIDEFDTFNAPKKRLLAGLLTAPSQGTVGLCGGGTPLGPGE